MINLKINTTYKLSYRVEPKDTWQQPQSFPKSIFSSRNSSKALPSNLCKKEIYVQIIKIVYTTIMYHIIL